MKMDLVRSDSVDSVTAIVRTRYSPEEVKEELETISLYIEEGSTLYLVRVNEKMIGYLVLSVVSEENERNDKYLTMELMEFIPEAIDLYPNLGEYLGKKLRELGEKFGATNIDLLIEEEFIWVGKSIEKAKFICEVINFSKMVPQKSNLDDIFDLIKQEFNEPLLIQVFFSKGDENKTEFVEEYEEIIDLLEEGWQPIVVSLSYSVNGANYHTIVEKTNEVIKWDDVSYNFVYQRDAL